MLKITAYMTYASAKHIKTSIIICVKISWEISADFKLIFYIFQNIQKNQSKISIASNLIVKIYNLVY